MIVQIIFTLLALRWAYLWGRFQHNYLEEEIKDLKEKIKQQEEEIEDLDNELWEQKNRYNKE